MTVRATKRGDERTPLAGEWDVVICGASFAGLSVARELHGSGARVLLVDRYEIGERQTSACAAPTEWLENLGLENTAVQSFDHLVVNAPERAFDWPFPFTYSTFRYRELCALLFAQSDATFETAKVEGRTVAQDGTIVVHTDRGDLRAPLVVDTLGWRRILGSTAVTPPNAKMSRGLEVHPDVNERTRELEIWLDAKYLRSGYSWSFPAAEEVRVGCGSFDPHDHVKDPTVRLASDLDVGLSDYQGNWIPHMMRDPTDGPIFFAGDSAGHCYPVTAEGIRPSIYYALALGRELRLVVQGRQTRAQALERYAAFCEDDRWAFRWLYRIQRVIGRITPYPAMTTVLELFDASRISKRAFAKYLALSPPSFALEGEAYPTPPAPAVAAPAAAAHPAV